MRPKDCAYIVEHLSVRFMAMVADHSRQLAEHRAAFGARTEADAKIIEGLRAAADEQVLSASKVAYVLRCAGETPVQAAQRVVKERDGLLTQVQDQRAEIERLRALPNPTPKRHPVKVGEWVKRTTRPYEDTPIGSIGQVAIVNTAMNSYRLDSGQRWSFEYCEPCDPPNHDTEAGKAAAESGLLINDGIDVRKVSQ